jgi:glycoprotein endo-alpha-1,2-mannosidase
MINRPHFSAAACAVLTLAGALCLALCGCTTAPTASTTDPVASQPAEPVHAFYYTWYHNPETDGQWSHWNEQIMLREGGGALHIPPDDIGSNFYPANGLYSANDPKILAEHMREMKQAGIGVAAVTWWGIGSDTDKTLPLVFDAAAAEGMKIAFHIEPFPGRNASTTRDALVYLLRKFGSHPALYRDHGRPVVYLYDSYLTPASEWASILAPGRTQSIRGTEYDTVFIGLWVKEGDGAFMEEGNFDGFYTYFATDGFTYGSTPANWPAMAQWAKEHGKIFIPCVGPGYDDTRIRPWNGQNRRDRENGAYYDRMFQQAVAIAPAAIAITSFNEWHEGTQIEAAVPKSAGDITYLDYGDLPPDWYLTRTRYWVEKWLGAK